MESALEAAAREAALEDGVAAPSTAGEGSLALSTTDSHATQEIRRGKWTEEEEAYANKLIMDFKDGILPLTDGTTLRTFLSKLLRCDPMRISKKFVGNNSIGKQVFRRRITTAPGIAEQIAHSRRELQELEKRFHDRLLGSSVKSRGASSISRADHSPIPSSGIAPSSSSSSSRMVGMAALPDKLTVKSLSEFVAESNYSGDFVPFDHSAPDPDSKLLRTSSSALKSNWTNSSMAPGGMSMVPSSWQQTYPMGMHQLHSPYQLMTNMTMPGMVPQNGQWLPQGGPVNKRQRLSTNSSGSHSTPVSPNNHNHMGMVGQSNLPVGDYSSMASSSFATMTYGNLRDIPNSSVLNTRVYSPGTLDEQAIYDTIGDMDYYHTFGAYPGLTAAAAAAAASAGGGKPGNLPLHQQQSAFLSHSSMVAPPHMQPGSLALHLQQQSQMQQNQNSRLHEIINNGNMDRVISSLDFLENIDIIANSDGQANPPNSNNNEHSHNSSADINNSRFEFPWGSPAVNPNELNHDSVVNAVDTNHSFSMANISNLDLPSSALRGIGTESLYDFSKHGYAFPSNASFQTLTDAADSIQPRDSDYKHENEVVFSKLEQLDSAANSSSSSQPARFDPYRGLSVLQSASNMALESLTNHGPAGYTSPGTNAELASHDAGGVIAGSLSRANTGYADDNPGPEANAASFANLAVLVAVSSSVQLHENHVCGNDDEASGGQNHYSSDATTDQNDNIVTTDEEGIDHNSFVHQSVIDTSGFEGGLNIDDPEVLPAGSSSISHTSDNSSHNATTISCPTLNQAQSVASSLSSSILVGPGMASSFPVAQTLQLHTSNSVHSVPSTGSFTSRLSGSLLSDNQPSGLTIVNPVNISTNTTTGFGPRTNSSSDTYTTSPPGPSYNNNNNNNNNNASIHNYLMTADNNGDGPFTSSSSRFIPGSDHSNRP